MGHFLSDNWGSLVGALGLLLTILTLVAARGAKQAAEEASTIGRRRNLVEELEEASGKMQQLGGWVRDQKWELVQVRAQEVLAPCASPCCRDGVITSDLRRTSFALR
jgi:hypothetical protein